MAQRRMRTLILKRMNMVLVLGCVIGLLSGCSSSRLRTTIVSGSEPTKVEVTQLAPEQLVAEESIVQPISTSPLMDIPVEEPARAVRQPEFASDILAAPKTPDGSSEIIAPLKSASAPAPPGEQIASAMPLRAEPAMQKPMAGIPPISIEPEMPGLPKAAHASAPSGEQIVSSMPVPAKSARQKPMAGIPPISIEPEMPALPRRSHDEVSSVSQEASVASPAIPLPVQPQPVEPAAELSQDSSVEEIQVPQASIPTTPEPSIEKEPIQLAKVMPQEPGMVEMTIETLEAALSDIYFDYDQFLIRDDAMLMLQVNAQLLTAKFAGKHIVIEGHCDERGTQSYNMVLGKRRAHTVKRFLADLGVPAENLQAVSYGKEKPFCTESTQDCWQENRRSHFLIQ